MAQVDGWRPEAAGEAGTGVLAAASAFDGAMTRVRRLAEVTVGGWKGAAGAAAALRAMAAQVTGNHIGTALLDIAEALGAVAVLERVCTLVREIEAEAHAHGCRILDNGEVTPPRSDTGNPVLDLLFQAGFDAKAQELRARLIPLLDTAGETDERAGTQLRAVADALTALRLDPIPGPSARVAGYLDGTALLPDDPTVLRALWDSLSPADQDALVAFDPLLGDRDGIPALARDHYNRLAVTRLRDRAAADYQRLTDRHPDWVRGSDLPTDGDGWIRLRQWEAERVEIRTRLAEYTAVIDQLGPNGPADQGAATGTGSGQPPRLLVSVDDRGHAAIALGNPDTAANVATFVPGTGSPLGTLGVGIDRSRSLLAAAQRADPSARTAVIAWYGYDAPPDLGAAMGDRRAREGGVALDRFEAGLRASHTGPAAHSTVIGHSYGSTVIGAAASGANRLAADAVVFAGSPGVGVDDVSQLRLTGIPAGRNGAHVFATADPADPVPRLGQFLHGTDPTDREFRATVFTSSGSSLDLPLLRALPVDVFAHGNYWDPGNPGLETQGEIIVGHPPR
ncbi:hypothetical protein D7D52_35535 [Nocardia yunnanensis]|uniref:DUF1023 domain-containing protein n=1 Tax=Nocardia yunnanensis TaxID=2382165 RepID=A0A386ZNY1_9NOCA|nr:alpha/beta hydrolase [Nocardia yunnanensis]AYF78265.1 hypothetical protein D7D52_35535 [Nocardia yunnanensis]